MSDPHDLRIMVTGAGGFLGRWAVADLIRRGLEVHGLGSAEQSPRTEPQGAHWHRADLLDPGAIDEVVARIRPTHLLHFAWTMSSGRSYVDPRNFAWVESSLRLLRRFREAGGRRSVLIGTCAEYDPPADGMCDERLTPLVLDRPEAGLPYAVCKAALGRLAASYADREGLLHAWARIFYAFGPGESPNRLVPYIVRSLLAGAEARCSAGTQVRNYMYAPDIGAACSTLLLSSVVGYVNVGGEQSLTVADLARTIGAKLGRPDLIKLGVVEPAAFDPPILVPKLAQLYAAYREMDWRPRVTMDQGLDRTIEWWRAQCPG